MWKSNNKGAKKVREEEENSLISIKEDCKLCRM